MQSEGQGGALLNTLAPAHLHIDTQCFWSERADQTPSERTVKMCGLQERHCASVKKEQGCRLR